MTNMSIKTQVSPQNTMACRPWGQVEGALKMSGYHFWILWLCKGGGLSHLTWVTPRGIFVLKSIFPQQVFTGSYYGQGPGLADLGGEEVESSSSCSTLALEQIHGYE